MYVKAYKKGNVTAMNQLHDRYPELAKTAFDDSFLDRKIDPAEDDNLHLFPILLDTARMTEPRIMNMVSYLTGELEPDSQYAEYLRAHIRYREVFNYSSFRYQKDYDAEDLWSHYFLGIPKLKSVIEYRKIQDLHELASRASDYFESYLKSMS